jgi:hypothetical protein
MSFTDLLRQHLPEQSKQKTLAMDWLARRQQSGSTWRPSYVESRFSLLLKGAPAAVRFFFGTRESAATLMEVLGVAPDARSELLAAADRHLADGPQHPPARMVIDVTRWSGTTAAKALFESVRAQMVEPALVTPAVLVVTPTLHEDLPRSFDKIEGLRVVVADAEQGDESAQELLADGTLLASPAPATDPAHWLAIDFDQRQGRLVVEPADGLARFARDGKLPLPPVEHDLAIAVADLPAASGSVPAPDGPIEMRRLMTRLRQEAEAADVSEDPAVRLAMANALGVVATSTPRDRIEADVRAAVAGLGVTAPAMATQADVERTLSRARRRPVGPTVMRVGDEILVINPHAGQPGLDHPRVQVHRVAAPEPEIARIRAAIAGWTIGDFEADPFLAGIIERLDPQGRDRLAFLHARAWLLALGIDEPAPGAPVDDWRAALMLLLAGDVPALMLMLPNSPAMGDAVFVAVASTLDGGVRADSVDDHTRVRLLHVPSPLTSVPIGQGEGAQHAQVFVEETAWSRRGPKPTRLALPARRKPEAEGVLDAVDDEWLDALDSFVGGRQGTPPLVPVAAVTLGEIKDLPWRDADRVLATTWLALHAAVGSNLAVRSRDGTITLLLGGGLAAVINLTSTAEDHSARKAFLECTPRLEYSRVTGHNLEMSVPVGIDGVSFRIPIKVVLLGDRVRAEIRFTASPLLLVAAGGGMGAPASSNAVQAAIAAAEAAEARRRASDDDDD